MLKGMSEYADKVHSLYTTTQGFMERCQQQTCAAAVGELAVASGLMLARSAQAYKSFRPRTVRPRLIVVTGQDPEERYAFDVATFTSESLMAPIIKLAHLLPTEAHNVPLSRRPFARLSRSSINNLTYNIGTARPTRISHEHAEHFFNRMLRHIMAE